MSTCFDMSTTDICSKNIKKLKKTITIHNDLPIYHQPQPTEKTESVYSNEMVLEHE